MALVVSEQFLVLRLMNEQDVGNIPNFVLIGLLTVNVINRATIMDAFLTDLIASTRR